MELFYKQYGEGGPPLLILHGLLGASGNWHTLSSNVFSQSFAVYALDLRNHGRSPHSDTFDYPSMAADVVQFQDAHGLASAHVLGHSMGGKAAMHLALHHPERVDRLVVADIAPKAYPPHHKGLLQALRRLDLAAHGSRSRINDALAEDVPDAAVRQFLLKNLDYDREADSYSWKMNLETIYRNYDAVNGAIEADAPFGGPVLFVRGGASDYVRDTDWSYIHTLFRQARLVTLDGAGHWVHAEQPDAFAETVMAFLSAA